jgi:hypothetical protein
MTACYGLVNELVYDLKGVSVAHLQHRDIRLPTRCRLPLVYLVSLETPFCSYPLPISSVQFRLRKLRWTFDVIEFFSFNKKKKMIYLSIITGSDGVSFLFPQLFLSQQRLQQKTRKNQ